MRLVIVTTRPSSRLAIFFFNDTATTEIYTLSLHDALPISEVKGFGVDEHRGRVIYVVLSGGRKRMLPVPAARSEEHTSELQSQSNLVCRLLLEKKKKNSSKWSAPGSSSILLISYDPVGL